MTLDFRFLKSLIFFFSVFPFLGLLPTDLEPYYFVLIFCYILLFFLLGLNFTLSRNQFLFISLLLLSSVYAFRLDQTFVDFFRTAVFFFTPIFYLIFLKISNPSKHIIINWCRAGLVIYLIFGFLEAYDFNFLEFLLSDRPRISRGVRSLAPEPSMYGFFSLILFAIIRILNEKKFLDEVLLFLNVLLAGSASVFIIAFPCLLILLFQNGIGLRNILLLVVLGVALPFLLTTRIMQLFQVGLLDLLTDESINERVGHIYFIFSNPSFYILGGHDSWGNSYFNFMNNSLYFFNGSMINNILSGIGQLIYDAGIFGVLVMIWIAFNIFKVSMINSEKFLLLIIFLGVFIQSVGLTNPMLSMLAVIPFVEFQAQNVKLAS